MKISQTTTTKALALFLSLGMFSSLAGCEMTKTDEGGDDAPDTEQTAPQQDDGAAEGGEGGEG